MQLTGWGDIHVEKIETHRDIANEGNPEVGGSASPVPSPCLILNPTPLSFLVGMGHSESGVGFLPWQHIQRRALGYGRGQSCKVLLLGRVSQHWIKIAYESPALSDPLALTLPT